ncbi:effector-associated domain 2-containing protein [Streptomyces sp. TLI_185]|uniref:effector-associated domain 2-containing protein n=1 Tax=Streptomyces sp. TLI_185 TaxID=2485151 RepID=UPI000FA4228F|nr:trypsin-like peptidase domain-containing protein [Streptomyces sp. TLI_185]RPF33055.1 trypsin-like peptidase [Streptomyces sp. TLI_185]
MARVAEVLVGGPPGAPGRRGSGYRVGDRHVLTAGHLLEPPLSTIGVRFDADRPGEWSTAARVVLRSLRADLSLLELADLPPVAPPIPHLPRYAVVPEMEGSLPVTAVGFPRFKLREQAGSGLVEVGSPVRFRDSCHVEGTVSVLSNRREGTFEVAVPPPADAVGPQRSPWEGMSGAALWSDGAIIGLITAHHRSDGLGRLAAVRVQYWYEVLDPPELELLQTHAGLPARPVPIGSRPIAEMSPPPSPRFASLPSTLTMSELKDLVDALTALPSLRRPNGLDTILESVDLRVAAHRPRDDRLRFDVYGVLRTCLRYPGALERFMEVLRIWEEDSEELRAVDRVAAELVRRHT